MKGLIGSLSCIGAYGYLLFLLSPASAQPIVPATDGTGTIVTPAGNRFDITGGALSGDGANLFHSFQEFGLSPEQVANFFINPDIQNVLGRVNGGNPSVINGLLQMSGGNANLFLMNPAGIVFGPDSVLNLSGGVTLTTADGIGFGPNWFYAVGSSDYATLVGSPDTLSFSVSSPGAIFNAGNLTVNAGQPLRLLGGSVINTGTLSAPGGTITVAAVPGEQWVRISQDSAVLSLDLPLMAMPAVDSPSAEGALEGAIAPLDIPFLLTGGGVDEASGVVVHGDGSVVLTGPGITIPTEPGTAITTGLFDTGCISSTCPLTSPVGGEIALVGHQVGVLGGTLTASGSEGGGAIFIGGSDLGQGPLPNAAVTVVDEGSAVIANAESIGDGGRVIIWSDQTSRIAGEIQARGGAIGGDGGFVETSSAGFLEILAAPDISAPVGQAGHWLIDPSDIEIGDFGGTSTNITLANPFEVTAAAAQLDISTLLAALATGTDVTVATAGPTTPESGNITLSAALNFNGTGTSNLTLTADNQIRIEAPIFDSVVASGDRLNLTLNGDVNDGSVADIVIADSIQTNGGSLTLNGPSGVEINAPINTAGGDITVGPSDPAFSLGSGVQVNAPIQSSGGTIAITGTASREGTSGLVINAQIDPGGSDLFLTGRGSSQAGPALVINTPFELNGENLVLQGGVNNGQNIGILIAEPVRTNGGNLTLLGTEGGIAVEALVETSGGDFTLDADGGATNLGRGVTIDAPIESGGGAVSITGRADDPGASGLVLNAPIDADGGTITLTGAGEFEAGSALVINTPLDLDGETLILAGSAASGDAAGIVIAEAIATNGGDLTLDGASGIAIAAPITTTGGNFTAEANGVNSTFGQGITIDAPIRSGGGAISIIGRADEMADSGLVINAAVDPALGPLTLIGQGGSEAGPALVINTPFEFNGDSLTLEGSVNAGNNLGILVAAPIRTNGANLTLNGLSGVGIEALVDTAGGDLVIDATGVISSTRGQGVTVNAPIQTNGGAVDIIGRTHEDNQSGLVVNSVIDAAGGELSLAGIVQTFTPGQPTVAALRIISPLELDGQDLVLNGNVTNGSAPGIQIDEAIRTNGGGLTLDGRSGVEVNGPIETAGGDIAIRPTDTSDSAAQILDVNIASQVDAGGGNITIESISNSEGTINILGALSTSETATITLSARDTLDAGDITNPGGNIQIISEEGSITTGVIDTSNPVGNAGDILVETQALETNEAATPTVGTITTGVLRAESGNGDGGDITITARGDIADITTGNITTIASGAGAGGTITLSTPDTINTTGGSIVSIGAGSGGDINLTAGSDIDTADIQALLVSGFTLDSGSIRLASTGGDVDTSAGALVSSAADGNGGNITVDATVGSLTVGTVDAQSIAADGGTLTFTTGQDIFLATGSVSTNNNDITFNHRVNLVGNATINSFGTGDVVFNTPVDGAHRLAVNAGQGQILLNETVGGTVPLTEFAFQGDVQASTASGFDISAAQLTLLGDTTITSAGNSGVAINAPLDGFHALTIDAGAGEVQINAPLGGAVPLNTLDVLDAIATNSSSELSIRTVNALSTEDITAPGGIRLSSPNGPITTAALSTTAIGNAGNVTLTTDGAASVTTIDAQSVQGIGGDVDITANGFFRATETFTDQNGTEASISVAGAEGGRVIIRHGGEGITPFTVGDADINGTAGAITRGDEAVQTIAPDNAFLNTYTQDQERLQLVSVPAEVTTPDEENGGSGSDGPSGNIDPDSNVDGGTGGNPNSGEGNSSSSPQALLASLLGNLLDATTQVTDNLETETTLFQWELPDGAEIAVEVNLPDEVAVPLGDEQGDLITALDQRLEDALEDHFGQEFESQAVSAQTIRQTLTRIETETDTRAVIVYAVPQADGLELILVKPDGDSIYVKVSEARRESLDAVISQFSRGVQLPGIPSYRQPAQQLYRWFITPLKAQLDALDIDTLIFIMDAGLRALPLAALHDGEQFLVEQYSLGLVPSFSLTDSRYQSLSNRQVLALGMSDFGQWPDLADLAFVENEITAIAQLWPGQQFQDADFTLSTLKSQRRLQEFGVIHLATHAQFEQEDPDQSYIQLWDTRLQMDQLRTLRLSEPPPIELLVLSACQTAFGSLSAELGFAGLAVNAGVKSALASLWNVSDESTALLMTLFYGALRSEPIKAEALRQAQLALIHGDMTPEQLAYLGIETDSTADRSTHLDDLAGVSTRDLSHPYYWAAFTMIGSPW